MRVFILLDILRIVAALGVLVDHCTLSWTGLGLPRVPIGHECVVVFFVLSGFIIPATASRPSSSFRHFATARVSRLWAVLLPSLALTILLDSVVRALGGPPYLERGWQIPRCVLTALFGSELWFLSAGPQSNTPVWSISYEFWFYVLFSGIFFPTSLLTRILWVSFGLLCAGPKIVLLFPVWCLGWLCWWLWLKGFSSGALGSVMIILGIIVILCQTIGIPSGGDSVQVSPPLSYSTMFRRDFLLGTGVALAILGVGIAMPELRDLCPQSTILRKMADLTFPLYLAHFPVLILIAETNIQFKSDSVGISGTLVLIAFITFCVHKASLYARPILANNVDGLIVHGSTLMKLAFGVSQAKSTQVERADPPDPQQFD